MKTLKDRVAVITGAGSGIGRALAQRCASEGMELALADVNAQGLNETAESLKTSARVSQHVLDVGKEDAVRKFADEVLAAHGHVHLLVNNAGVGLHGFFEEISLRDFEWLMQINFWGVVYGCRYFLPAMRQEPEAQIVNISSVFGIIAPAGQTHYGAAKFAVRGFSEALRHELEDTNVRVAVVHPGGIRTAIARNARCGEKMDEALSKKQAANFDNGLAMATPEFAADTIIDGVLRGKTRILIGKDARQIDFLQRMRPEKYWATITKQIESKAPGTVRHPYKEGLGKLGKAAR